MKKEQQPQTRYHVTLHSMGHKLIGLTVWRTPSNTCPDSCPLKNTGCYDQDGNCNIHRQRHDNGEYKSLNVVELLKKSPAMTSVVRASIGGDLAGQSNIIDKQENVKLFKGLHKAHKKVLLYTHKPITHGGSEQERNVNLQTIKAIQKVAPSLAINVSCEQAEQVDQAINAGFDAVCIVPDDNQTVRTTPEGNKIVNCPEAQGKTDGCAMCGSGKPLCTRKNRGYAIGFPAHGSRAKKVTNLLK